MRNEIAQHETDAAIVEPEAFIAGAHETAIELLESIHALAESDQLPEELAPVVKQIERTARQLWVELFAGYQTISNPRGQRPFATIPTPKAIAILKDLDVEQVGTQDEEQLTTQGTGKMDIHHKIAGFLETCGGTWIDNHQLLNLFGRLKESDDERPDGDYLPDYKIDSDPLHLRIAKPSNAWIVRNGYKAKYRSEGCFIMITFGDPGSMSSCAAVYFDRVEDATALFRCDGLGLILSNWLGE